MLSRAIQKVVSGFDLEESEITEIMDTIMEGNATAAQIGGFITALRIKGETIEEITGCAKVMREKACHIHPKVAYSIDTCGTGGDGANTFNISTAAAFVAASGGVIVAKHGNRSVSSRSGSADVLEALGINISLDPEKVCECIEKTGMGFMFAPTFHKSMKYAAGPRKELGIRTVFNLLGPLTNPANAKGQVLGVFAKELTEPLARVLLNLGVERAMVVHGSDGLDEITTTGSTFVSEVKEGKVLNYEIVLEDFGLPRANKTDLTGGDAYRNAEILIQVFRGERGPARDIILLNAAASLYVGKAVEDMENGLLLAADIIDSGKAMSKLYELKRFTNSCEELSRNILAAVPAIEC